MESTGIMIDLIYLFISAAMAFVLYPLWINFVYKFQIGEDVRVDGPQTHLLKRGTPTMGGLVFVFVTAIVTFMFNRSRTQTLFPIFIAAMAGLMGILEDFTKVYKKSGLPGFLEYHFGQLSGVFFRGPRRPARRFPIISSAFDYFKNFWRVIGSSERSGIQTYQKFLIQAGVGGFVAYWTYFKLGWDYIWFPLLGDVHVGFLYPIFVFVLFIVMLNFIAFTDGIDGLAGGLALMSVIGFWVLSRVFEYNSLAGFCATLVGALLPFMYFNIFPARVFMGNVGSHVLGAILTMLAVILHREVAFIIMAAVFFIDGASSPLQQWSVMLTKKRLFRMAPMHHHFELLGWPETKVTMRFWLFGILFTLAGIFIALL